MKLSQPLRDKLAERLREAKAMYPAALSQDGRALLVDGGPGYGAYVSPDGDIFLETYDIADDCATKVDRSAHAQVMVLVLGSRRIPELASLLPPRAQDAPNCAACEGDGWLRIGADVRVICTACGGLGWSLAGRAND